MINKFIFRNITNKSLLSNFKNIFNLSKYNFATKPNQNSCTDADIDQAFKNLYSNFKSTWNEFTEENEQKTKSDLEKKLTKEQISNVEILADKFGELNEIQIAYYKYLLEEMLVNKKKLTYIDTNTNWSGLINLEKKHPDANLNVYVSYFQQQEFMVNFTNWLSKQPKPDLGLMAAAAAPGVQTEKKEEKKVEEKKEEKKEKTVFDIELTSFDAAKKVALIKEVRGFTNLGLKESKELVEKAPAIILKGIKKEDTEAIIKKLTENGAKITLK